MANAVHRATVCPRMALRGCVAGEMDWKVKKRNGAIRVLVVNIISGCKPVAQSSTYARAKALSTP